MRFSPVALLLLFANCKNVVGELPDLCEPNCYCVPEGGGECPPFSLSTGLPIDPITGFPKLLFAAAYNAMPEFIGFLNSLSLVNPPDVLDCQPYPLLQDVKPGRGSSSGNSCGDSSEDSSGDSSDDDNNKVCVYQYNDDDLCSSAPSYTMTTKERSEVDPADSLEFITHEGSCGFCSNAADLANVWFNPILNAVAYTCSRAGDDTLKAGGSIPDALEVANYCFLAAGFSEDCAYLWASNALNSPVAGCTEVCDAWLGEPPADLSDPSSALFFQRLAVTANDPVTCALQECLACDEEESGEIFKEYSGRTRRNSGILTVAPVFLPPDQGGFFTQVYVGLKRPCDSIADILQFNPLQMCEL